MSSFIKKKKRKQFKNIAVKLACNCGCTCSDAVFGSGSYKNGYDGGYHSDTPGWVGG